MLEAHRLTGFVMALRPICLVRNDQLQAFILKKMLHWLYHLFTLKPNDLSQTTYKPNDKISRTKKPNIMPVIILISVGFQHFQDHTLKEYVYQNPNQKQYHYSFTTCLCTPVCTRQRWLWYHQIRIRTLHKTIFLRN